jgi:CHAT domain-containing protein
VLRAEVLAWKGLSSDALSLISEEPPHGISNETLIRRKVVLGIADSYLQGFDEADRLLLDAQALSSAAEPTLLGDVFLAQGVSAVIRSNYADAKSSYYKALQLARQQKKPLLEASALGNLGILSTRTQHYDEAIDWYRAALKSSEALGNRASIAKATGNLGWCYLMMGDLDKASDLLDQAVKLSAELGFVRDQQIWLANIGNVYFHQRKYETANEKYSEALAIAKQLQNKTLEAITLNEMTDLAIVRKNFGQAVEYNKQAEQLSRITKDRTYALVSVFQKGLIAQKTGNMSEAERLFKQVGAESAESVSFRWKSQAALAELYAEQALHTRADAQFRKALTEIDDARASLSKEEYRLSFLNTATEFYNDYIDFLISRGRVEDALAVAEHSRARTLAEGLGIEPASLGESALRPTEIARRQNAVILAYWLKPERSYVWAVTQSKVALFSLPADTEIDGAVQAFRKALTGPRDPLEIANNSGQQLYQIMVQPAQNLIPANSRVVIIADGSLHGLNFETLLAPASKASDQKPHYWIEDVTISNANSLALVGSSVPQVRPELVPRVRAVPFPANPEKANLGESFEGDGLQAVRPAGNKNGALAPEVAKAIIKKPNLLLIGNAVSASAEFPPLPQAADEIHNVASHFSDETIIDGPKATPAAYLASDPGKFSYIHFVAHGTASRLSPLDSAVVLSPQGDSYKLYARDIVEKPLRADLVTISACYGSGSRAYSGEGLVGLSWAFLRAGSRNVVAALWEANDVSTPKLMDAMYSGLSAGKDPASALHDAKLAMLHSDGVYRRPFYWAPFQLYVGSGRTSQITPKLTKAAHENHGTISVARKRPIARRHRVKYLQVQEIRHLPRRPIVRPAA